MKIRKQVYELTTEDINEYPAWEFALDEEGEENQDEATVRPYPLDGPFDASGGMAIVRAKFQLADGTQMIGYLTPPPTREMDLGTIQPQIITPGGQVSFWCGVVKPSPETVARLYRLLDRAAPQVFPIVFSSDVEIVGGPVTGQLDGFLYWEMKADLVHTIL